MSRSSILTGHESSSGARAPGLALPAAQLQAVMAAAECLGVQLHEQEQRHTYGP
jgi:hypothetical protein